MIIYIGGTRLDHYAKDSCKIEDAVDERSVAEFFAIDIDGTATYTKGQTVTIKADDDTTYLFGGVIDSAEPVKIGGRKAQGRYWRVTCADWHYLADKRLAKKVYTNQTAGAIGADLFSSYLSTEGCSSGTFDDGPTCGTVVFSYVPVSRAYAVLAEKSQQVFRISPEREVSQRDRASNAAPFAIDDDTVLRKGSIIVKRANPAYRNRQYVKDMKFRTDLQTEKQYGDGEKRAFVLPFPPVEEPTITLFRAGASSSQEVGIRGVEEGWDFGWNKGDPIVNHTTCATAIAPTDYVEIEYYGEYRGVVLSYDAASIVTLKAREGLGGTGYVESVVSEPSLTSATQGFELAAQLLSKYSVLDPETVEFDVHTDGLQPGQYINIVRDDYDLDDDYLIERVSHYEEDGYIWHRVKAVSGPSIGSWARFFSNLANKAEQFSIYENINEDEVLAQSSTQSDTWYWSENTSEHVYACPVPAVDLFPASTLYPC
jgi:hypothetical protein